MKKLIINADDYGLDDDINQAIISLAHAGVITSTSVMANFASDESIEQLKLTPVSTGLHLNLIEGKPVSDVSKVRSLIDESGNFLSWNKLLTGFMLNRIKKNELEIEIENQLRVLEDKGLIISHVDSHKHIHQYPVLGPFILNKLRKMGVLKVRNCAPSNWKHHRMFMLTLFSLITQHNLSSFQTTRKLVTWFSVNSNFNTEGFTNELSELFRKYDVLEVMAHPGLRNHQSYYNNRQLEYEYLMHVFIKRKEELTNIQFISYSEL